MRKVLRKIRCLGGRTVAVELPSWFAQVLAARTNIDSREHGELSTIAHPRPSARKTCANKVPLTRGVLTLARVRVRAAGARASAVLSDAADYVVAGCAHATSLGTQHMRVGWLCRLAMPVGSHRQAGMAYCIDHGILQNIYDMAVRTWCTKALEAPCGTLAALLAVWRTRGAGRSWALRAQGSRHSKLTARYISA